MFETIHRIGIFKTLVNRMTPIFLPCPFKESPRFLIIFNVLSFLTKAEITFVLRCPAIIFSIDPLIGLPQFANRAHLRIISGCCNSDSADQSIRKLTMSITYHPCVTDTVQVNHARIFFEFIRHATNPNSGGPTIILLCSSWKFTGVTAKPTVTRRIHAVVILPSRRRTIQSVLPSISRCINRKLPRANPR